MLVMCIRKNALKLGALPWAWSSSFDLGSLLGSRDEYPCSLSCWSVNKTIICNWWKTPFLLQWVLLVYPSCDIQNNIGVYALFVSHYVDGSVNMYDWVSIFCLFNGVISSMLCSSSSLGPELYNMLFGRFGIEIEHP